MVLSWVSFPVYFFSYPLDAEGAIRTTPPYWVLHNYYSRSLFTFVAIHSMLTVKFGLRRHTGYFLIHIVIPCSLLVVLSWVSFWINREATADRIALGILISYFWNNYGQVAFYTFVKYLYRIFYKMRCTLDL